jgi:hypothetical protein
MIQTAFKLIIKKAQVTCEGRAADRGTHVARTCLVLAALGL